MRAILDSVSVVDPVVDGGIGVLKSDIFLHVIADDASFVTNLRATQPRDGRTISRSNVDIIANRTTHTITALRNVPSRRSDAILSSSAPPILFDSSFVHVAIGSAFMMNETVSMAKFIRPSMPRQGPSPRRVSDEETTRGWRDRHPEA